jgi:hypothetical protein
VNDINSTAIYVPIHTLNSARWNMSVIICYYVDKKPHAIKLVYYDEIKNLQANLAINH